MSNCKPQMGIWCFEKEIKNMQLNIHTIPQDRSSESVQQWIRFMGFDVSYTDEDLITNKLIIEISNDKTTCYHENSELNNRLWFRRGRVVTGLRNNDLQSIFKFDNLFRKDFEQINKFSGESINYVINRPHQNDINKLLV